ncbi:site-specific integrase [Nocardioides antri]|uniref:Site-specific integrase n=1 Tax=Nocardioides antri TaxID=2607659 RepID=A0A5B1M527_9ACTN|nr:tyrosine-type recombinase/integrase [Nocardioides antri]KAA1427871.1 site-specific integrase [Nocardioides antri]
MRITKPKPGEPIRFVESKGGPRYRVVLDVSPKGASRRQVTRTYATLREARAFVEETRTRVRQGNYTAPSRVTVRQLAEDWLRSRVDVREVTVNGYRGVLAPVLERVGERPAQTFTRRDVEALMMWCEESGGARGKGLSQRSLVYTLGTLRQVFAYGVSLGVLATNPAADVKARRRTKGNRNDVEVWDVEQLLTFRQVADVDPWAAAWRLTLCGLRRSEVLGMSWRSVDVEAGSVQVEASRVALTEGRTAVDDTKSAASHRAVPVESMHPGTVGLLRALSARQAADRLAAGGAYADSGLMLVDALGQEIAPDAYSARFRALCRQAGVPVIRLHAVRHTLALMLHRAGEAPADVAALLGHTVATHLAVYVPGTERGARSAAGRFGEVLAAVR